MLSKQLCPQYRYASQLNKSHSRFAVIQLIGSVTRYYFRIMDEENVERPLTEKDDSDHRDEFTYDFDLVLEHIGNMGKYQALLAIFVIYLTLPVGMHDVGSVFLLAVPDHRCFVPGVDEVAEYANCSNQQILDLTTPRNAEVYSLAYAMCIY